MKTCFFFQLYKCTDTEHSEPTIRQKTAKPYRLQLWRPATRMNSGLRGPLQIHFHLPVDQEEEEGGGGHRICMFSHIALNTPVYLLPLTKFLAWGDWETT